MKLVVKREASHRLASRIFSMIRIWADWVCVGDVVTAPNPPSIPELAWQSQKHQIGMGKNFHTLSGESPSFLHNDLRKWP
jgi:hypothetical protein